MTEKAEERSSSTPESVTATENSTAIAGASASHQIAPPKAWCRCPDPLPECENWKCSACGLKRRYTEKISVQNGGVVARCGECRWTARCRNAPESSVALTLCRAVTDTTLLAGKWRERNTYYLCDPCTDAEIARNKDADVFDGRQKVPA